MKKTKKLGFKYHDFLKSFALFALALINSVYAAFYFSGIMYSWTGDPSINADMIYTIYGQALKTLDLTYGGLLALATILLLIARHRLANLSKDGVYITMAAFIYQGIVPFVYSFWGNSIMSSAKSVSLKNVILLTFFAALSFLTFRYYCKREEMFKKQISNNK